MVSDERQIVLEAMKRFTEKVSRLIGKETVENLKKKQEEMKTHWLHLLHRFGHLPYAKQVALMLEVGREMGIESRDGKDIFAKEIADSARVEGFKIVFKGGVISYAPLPVGEGKKSFVVSLSKFEHLKKDLTALASHEEGSYWDKLLEVALSMEASDIHVVPKSDHYFVFFRVKKGLVLMDRFSLSKEEGRKMLRWIKTYAYSYTKGMFRPDLTTKVQDARAEFPKYMVTLRLAFAPLPNLEDEVMVARILLQRSVETNLEKLGYLPEDVKVFSDVLKRSGGIAVVSGITNSGKTTFVTSLLSRIKDRRVGTVEDPVEYIIPNPNVAQHQVFETGVEEIRSTFLDYVRAFKRQDYDVIFVGEWRNNPELSKAIEEFSLAGQLVFTTLHINSAFVIFDALKSMYGVPKEVLLRTLIFSMNQTLVRKPSSKARKMKIREAFEFLEESGVLTQKTVDYLPYTNAHDLKNLIEADEIEVFVESPDAGPSEITPVYEYFYPDVEFKEWIAKTSPTPFEIEKEARARKLGKNKLDVFIRKLKRGEVTLNGILALR